MAQYDPETRTLTITADPLIGLFLADMIGDLVDEHEGAEEADITRFMMAKMLANDAVSAKEIDGLLRTWEGLHRQGLVDLDVMKELIHAAG